jgi:hypothetical protein
VNGASVIGPNAQDKQRNVVELNEGDIQALLVRLAGGSEGGDQRLMFPAAPTGWTLTGHRHHGERSLVRLSLRLGGGRLVVDVVAAGGVSRRRRKEQAGSQDQDDPESPP